MLDKSIRKAMKTPTPLKNPYAALMEPMVIVPDVPEDKVVIADAGTIVRFMDQSGLYRDRTSPITRRADELLVQYGKPDKLKLGWLSHMRPDAFKPSRGPTFLVTTKAEESLMAWEQIRLKVARTRKSDPTNWIAPWLVMHGEKHAKLLREVTRFFGGKPIKNEEFSVRCARLFQLILKVELDMATAKNSKSSKKSKKSRKQDAEQETKSSKKSDKKHKKQKSEKVKTKKSAKSDDRITKDQDDYIIKRLIKENPRRAGSAKAKIWDKLKKGMTVGEFLTKGGSRGAVRLYVQNEWAKLIAPKSGGGE